MSALEGVEVALSLSHFKLLNLADMLSSVLILIDGYELETYSIVKSLFVDDILHLVLLAREHIALDHVFFLLERYDIDAIPA